MRKAAVPLLAIAAIVAISVLVAEIAATFALGRGAGTLDVSLASLIPVDYSIDPPKIPFAPLDERIIDQVRRDDAALDTPGANNGASVPRESIPQGSVTPTPRPSFSASPTPTVTFTKATPTPTFTLPVPTLPVHTPTSTPTPGMTWTATPSPVPALPRTFYLHNEPSPPLWDTASHATLAMNTVTPVAPLLFNYDTDRDDLPGIVIHRGASGVDETDPVKQQVWRSSAQPTRTRIEGAVTIDVWAAMNRFSLLSSGSVTGYLRDFDGTTSTTISRASAAVNGTPTWSQTTMTLDACSYILPAGHSLEIRLTVDESSGDDIMFAYDTISHPSRVKINQ